MKNIPPQPISLTLFLAGTFAALLSCSLGLTQPTVAVGLAYFSSLAFFVRAFLEWQRPEDQLVRSLVWGATIAVIYSLVFPAWAKVKLPVIPWLVMMPILLNAIVPMLRATLRLLRRRA
jgi:hypothetical protein